MLSWLDLTQSLWLVAGSLQQRLALDGSPGQITCLQNATYTFEDLVTCFDNYTVSDGYYSDETYAVAQPTAEELCGWEDLVSSLLSVDGNCTSVVVPESIAGIYDVSLFTDPTGPQFCVASESTSVDGVYAKGWGLVAVPATQGAIMRDIHLAAPHPAYDLFTPEQAGALFKSTGARSLLISGRVRTAILEATDCVIPASNSTIYYKTDPAHDVVSTFNQLIFQTLIYSSRRSHFSRPARRSDRGSMPMAGAQRSRVLSSRCTERGRALAQQTPCSSLAE